MWLVRRPSLEGGGGEKRKARDDFYYLILVTAFTDQCQNSVVGISVNICQDLQLKCLVKLKYACSN
jgi:hypothetical protein